MIVLDANVLLHAYNSSAAEHPRVKAWLETQLERAEPIALSWWSISAFLRLSMHRAIFPQPMTPREATVVVSRWLERSNVVVLEPRERYWPILSRLLVETNARGNLVPDACLAALALENGAKLATTDRDFRRFDGVELIDPLVG